MTECKFEIEIAPKKYKSLQYFNADALAFLARASSNQIDVEALFDEFLNSHNYERDDSLIQWFKERFVKHRQGVLLRSVNEFLETRRQDAYDSKAFLESFLEQNRQALSCTADEVKNLIDSLRKVQECKCPALVRAVREFDLAHHLHMEIPYIELDEKTNESVRKSANMWDLLIQEFAEVPLVVADKGMWWYYDIRAGVKLKVNVKFGRDGFHYYYSADVDYNSDSDLANVSAHGDCDHIWDISLGEWTPELKSDTISQSFKTRQWIVANVKIEVQEKIDKHKQSLENKKRADQARADADAKVNAAIDAAKAESKESKQVSEFADLVRVTCLAKNEWDMSLASHTVRSATRANMTSVLQKLRDCPIVAAKFTSLSETLELMAKIERDRQMYDQMSREDTDKIQTAIGELAVFVMQHLQSLAS